MLEWLFFFQRLKNVRNVEKWETLYTVGGNGAAGMANHMEIPQKVKNRTTHFWTYPVPFLDIYPKELKSRNLHSYVHCSTTHSSQDKETV
jgi:hypothetical protein